MSEFSGKRILITRARAQSEDFIAALLSAGAEPVIFPSIRIAPAADLAALDRALSELARYDWLVLTSVNGVEAVWERREALGIQGIPGLLRIAAIGPKTAGALQARGVRPDFVPDEYVAEAILPGLGDLRGRRVLLARADIARPALRLAIEAAGGVADEIAAYRTLPVPLDPESLEALRAGVDVITFASSSTVRNFIELVHGAGLDPLALPGDPIIACIGPITAGTARETGLPVALVAEKYTIEGLLGALKSYFAVGQESEG